MSDNQILFIILILLYLTNCVLWTSRDSFVFRTMWNLNWKVLQGEIYVGAWDYRLIFLNPILLPGNFFVCHILPICVSRYGATYLTPETGSTESRNERVGYLDFDKIHKVHSAGQIVLADGIPFLKTHSEAYAWHLADFLDSIRACVPDQRDATIETRLSVMMDADLAVFRIRQYRRQCRMLHLCSSALFVAVFALFPSIVWHWGLLRPAPFMFTYLVLNLCCSAWLFRNAHACLYPLQSEGRWSQVATILLSPPAAIRACDLLLKDLLCGFHPLVIARITCNDSEFVGLASRVLREIVSPPLVGGPSADDLISQCRNSHRERLGRILEKFIAKTGMDPTELLAPPARQSKVCLSYCPRCRVQFTRATGFCNDCKGVALQTLPLSGRPQ